MKVEIRSSFEKAAKKLPPNLQHKVADIILDIEKAKTIRELNNCKKMTGYKTAYRIRLEDYRIGFFYEKGIVDITTVMLRKDIYKDFP
jgi:mRNA interferase RelE/StbE